MGHFTATLLQQHEIGYMHVYDIFVYKFVLTMMEYGLSHMLKNYLAYIMQLCVTIFYIILFLLLIFSFNFL